MVLLWIVLLTVFGFLAIGLYSMLSGQEGAIDMGGAILLGVIEFLLGCLLFALPYNKGYSTDDDTYYLPCEIVAQNETSTYFGTVDAEYQEIYAVETRCHEWPDDVPYLLYMDSKSTEDVRDDEVLCVWRAD